MIAAAAATTAPVVNPRENPAAPEPAMLVAAMLETTAAPREAPNSWKVLTIPEATPASCGSTWPSAVTEATTNKAPMPAAATPTHTTHPTGSREFVSG